MQLIYYWGWQQSEIRIETYLKILKILEGEIMWLSWHYHQVIINKPLLDFEKALWSSATGLWKDTDISEKGIFRT